MEVSLYPSKNKLSIQVILHFTKQELFYDLFTIFCPNVPICTVYREKVIYKIPDSPMLHRETGKHEIFTMVKFSDLLCIVISQHHQWKLVKIRCSKKNDDIQYLYTVIVHVEKVWEP